MTDDTATPAPGTDSPAPVPSPAAASAPVDSSAGVPPGAGDTPDGAVELPCEEPGVPSCDICGQSLGSVTVDDVRTGRVIVKGTRQAHGACVEDRRRKALQTNAAAKPPTNDSRPGYVGIDHRKADGTPGQDGIVDSEAPRRVIEHRGRLIEVAAIGFADEQKLPTADEIVADLEQELDNERKWKGRYKAERDKHKAAAASSNFKAWIAFWTAILIFVFYVRATWDQWFADDVPVARPPAVASTPAPTPAIDRAAAEAWLKRIRPLIDDIDTDTDDYSEGRKVLGLDKP